MIAFNGFSTTATPTVNELIIDVAIASILKICIQKFLCVTAFNTAYFQEVLKGAPRWTYLINVFFQSCCFLPFGLYAFMQYETFNSFLNCKWETYILPCSRFYGIMLSSYMVRDVLNCLYSTDLILHHTAGALVTFWAMCQPCGLELYLVGVSALEIGSMCNNLAVLANDQLREKLFFVNNFIFFVGHVVTMYLVFQILIGDANMSYRYFVFTSTIVIVLLRTSAIYSQYKEGVFPASLGGEKKKN